MKCVICGKEFETKGNNHKYCGEGCRRKAYQTKHKAKIYDRLKHSNTKTYQKVAREVYGYKCAICGWNELDQARKYLDKDELLNYCYELSYDIQNGTRLRTATDVHHIKHVANGGSDELDNLIVLCPNCHRLAHNGIIATKMLRKYQIGGDYEKLETSTKRRTN